MDYSIFKKYDIRGIYPNQINEGVVYRIFRNFNKIFKTDKPIIIGHDVRNGSRELYNSAIAGLAVSGIKTINVGLITTPMLSYLVKSKCAGGGVMITASHNPKEFNGIKIIDSKTDSIGGSDILKIIGKNRINKNIDISKIISLSKKEENNTKDFSEEYFLFLEKFINISRKVKVVIDFSNGSTALLVPYLKNIKNIEVLPINDTFDGNFPIHSPNPLEKNSCDMLKNIVVENNADFGVVFDGDGDRAVIVDDHGERICPEYVWRIMLINNNFKKVVHDSTGNILIKNIINNLYDLYGIHIKKYISKVGHSFVSKKMENTNSDIGFEYSGHYYFKDFFYKSSGLFTFIKMLNSVSSLPYKLSYFNFLMPKVFRITDLDFEAVLDKKIIFKKIKKLFSKYSAKIYNFDGLGISLNNSWISIRKSNTENIFRVNIESTNENDLYKIKNEIINFFDKTY